MKHFFLHSSRYCSTVNHMKQCKTTKTWARTGHRNLLKHQQSGNYYARTFAGGKEIWKSLKTSHRSVAEASLTELVKDHRKRLGNAGVIYANPAAALKRVTIRTKEIVLPSTDEFNALIVEMLNGNGRDTRNCADFAAGLAFTGCRLGEAGEIAWRDVDFDAGEIVV